MATTQPRRPATITPTPPPEKGGGKTWLIIGVGAMVLSLILLLALLHTSGAIEGTEEGIYKSVKNVPVIGFLAKPLHREKWSEKLSPEKMVDVKELRISLIRTQRELQDLQEKNTRSVEDVVREVKKVSAKVSKMKKDLDEGTYTGGAPAAAPVAAAPIMGGTPAQAAVPPAGVAPPAQTGGGDNYRAVAKIFDKIPADTVVDIFNNLTEREKVEVLSAMKDKNVADVVAALDPRKAAEILRMMAERKGK